MPKRITSLTPAQTERIASFAQEWIQRGWRTQPLTEDEWALQAEGMRRCYEYARIPWHGNVVRVSSPLVGALAASLAALLISGGKCDAAVGNAVGNAVDDAVGGAVGGAVRAAVNGAVGGAVGDAVGGAVRAAVHGAVGGAVGDAVRAAVNGAVDDAVGDAVDDAVRAAVDGAVGNAVDDAVGDAVGGAVRAAVHGAVGGAVRAAVHGAVNAAVDGAVGDAVDDAVRAAVDGAVGGAVGDAVDGAVGRIWYRRFGGRIWPWWQSYIAYFRDVAQLQLDGDLWDRARAYEDAQSAGWWWPLREFVMVCDVPTELHVEQIRSPGWGSHRLHCETGPAVAWADGWGVYAWHGVQVPESLIVHGWDTARILREPNAEVRRCAIERLGWDRFIVDARLAQVGTAVADPGNPGHDLALFDVPVHIYDEPVRVLLCSNATPERDGTRRRFGLTVPASIPDPVSAAAWTFGVDPADYRNLQRAS